MGRNQRVQRTDRFTMPSRGPARGIGLSGEVVEWRYANGAQNSASTNAGLAGAADFGHADVKIVSASGDLEIATLSTANRRRRFLQAGRCGR